MKKEFIIGVILLLSLVGSIYALDEDRQTRLEFGHVVFINSVNTDPSTIVPGNPANLNIIVENTGKKFVSDVRVNLDLPENIVLFNDVSQKKILRLESGISQDTIFKIMASPDADEGIYKVNLTVDYVSHIGEERQDEYDIGIVVKSSPNIFVKIDDVGVYKGNEIGEITVTFVNNDLANIRFLTIELLESEDYNLLSPSREYIGDLDSDDFESVNFKLKVKSDQITLPLKITYKDALNEDYSDDIELSFEVKTQKELGIKNNNTTSIIVIIIIIALVGYFIYRRIKKKKRRSHLEK